MDLKTFRESHGYTQAQMADILQGACPGIDRSLVSKIERGLCLPTAEVSEWLNEACAHGVDERNNEGGIDYRSDKEKALKSAFWSEIYSILENAPAGEKVSRAMLRIKTGRGDRACRDAIHEMREESIFICSSSSESGYWLCQSEEDLRTLLNEYTSRLKSCRKIVALLKARLADYE